MLGRSRRLRPYLSWLLAASVVACASRDPAREKMEALKRADELTAGNRHQDAAKAYQAALDIEPSDAQVRVKLSKALAAGGRWAEAMREAVRAADDLPGNGDAQSLAIERLNGMRKFLDGKLRSTELLKNYPNDPNVLILWGNATAHLQDNTWALYTYPDVVRSADHVETVRRTLRKEVAEYEDAEAGDAFHKAARLAPTSWDARIALVNFLWATARPDEAEPMLKALADESPRHAVVNHALGAYYLWHKRRADAELYLRKAAGTGVYGRKARFVLANLYLETRRDQEALEVLRMSTPEDDQAGEVSLLAAPLEFRLGQREAAMARVDKLLERRPPHPQAVIYKAQFLLDMGRIDEGLKMAREAVAVSLNSGDAHAALGQALSAIGDLSAAFDEYAEAARLNPSAPKPQVELARLSLALGRDKNAVDYAREAVRRFPDDREVAAMLAKALVRNRNFVGAELALKPWLTKFPDSPDLLSQLGAVQAAHGDARSARETFTRSLQADPSSFDSLAGLVDLDLRDRRTDLARQRIETALASSQSSAPHWRLAARVYTASNDWARVETALRRAAALDPFAIDVAEGLADALLRQQRQTEARQVLEQLVARRPTSIAAQTVLAGLLERIGDRPGAKAVYERIVAQDPRAGVASRQLAALHLAANNLDTALNFAITAKRQLPDDPAASNLIGWIYTRKDLALSAVPHLEDAVRAEPNNALYRYHLGVAFSNMGDPVKAREHLTRAVALDGKLDDARAALAGLPR